MYTRKKSKLFLTIKTTIILLSISGSLYHCNAPISTKTNKNAMITRVFRAEVPKPLHTEFEKKFKSISVPLVVSYKDKGLVSMSIAGPTQWKPNEFVMISVWSDEEAVRNFAGKKWNEAVIPPGMEKYITQCWVDHYQNIDF